MENGILEKLTSPTEKVAGFLYLLYKLTFLFRRAVLEELLYDVVAKDVRHERVAGADDLLEDQLLVCLVCPLKLLLDEARPVLVLRKLNHVVGQVTQLHVGVPVVPAKKPK